MDFQGAAGCCRLLLAASNAAGMPCTAFSHTLHGALHKAEVGCCVSIRSATLLRRPSSSYAHTGIAICVSCKGHRLCGVAVCMHFSHDAACIMVFKS
jgi:hypothetical protein